MADPIHFYFDFSSSYSYLAYDRIGAVADRFDRELVRKPIALGAIFKSNEHAPPSPGTDKGRYIYHDVERQAALQDKPYVWPKPFPYNSIPAARGYYWMLERHPDQAAHYVDAVFATVFGQGLAVDAEALGAIAARLGAEADAFVEGLGDPDVKSRLIEETQAAQAAGVFGAPSFLIGEELFWGDDRIASLEQWLEQNG